MASAPVLELGASLYLAVAMATSRHLRQMGRWVSGAAFLDRYLFTRAVSPWGDHREMRNAQWFDNVMFSGVAAARR